MTADSSNRERRSRALTIAAALLLLTLVGAQRLSPAEAADPPSQAGRADSAVAAGDTTARLHRVIAYYFHTTYRCSSCRKIEIYSREALQAAFPKELEAGRLVWRVVNVEEKGNEHFVKDYQIYTKSLVLVEERNGRQSRWKNAAKVWEFLRDKNRFFEYVQGEARAYLTDQL